MDQKSLREIFTNYIKEDVKIFKSKDTITEKYVPGNIPHREKQISQLAKILAPAINGDKVSNVFIYGSTGTGKSVSVLRVVNEMESVSNKVKTLYVNCKMKRVSDTEYRLLAELSRMLDKPVPATGLPTDEVYRTFCSGLDSLSTSIVLILDEIDTLVKKAGDDILYTLTRVNQELASSKISIIGISNDTAFTERLDPRVKSSLSEEEIVFQPYDARQLYDILIERTALAFQEGIINSGVIQKCAALAAQEHGDARRALDLMRIAGELAEREGSKRVTIDHMNKAEEKLDLDRTIEIVKFQPRQSQAVLASVIKLIESGQKNIQTGDIFAIYEKIAASRGLKRLTQRRLSDLVAELDMLGVINARVISKGRYGRTREVRLLLSDQSLAKVKRLLKDNYLLTDSLFLDVERQHG